MIGITKQNVDRTILFAAKQIGKLTAIGNHKNNRKQDIKWDHCTQFRILWMLHNYYDLILFKN